MISQIDTIFRVIPADALCPRDRGTKSPRHATILGRLPRFGDQVGLIPETPGGHTPIRRARRLQPGKYPALGNALPMSKPLPRPRHRSKCGAERRLQHALAKERPNPASVFRLRDQTPAAIEALGTLQVSSELPAPRIRGA